MKNKLLLTFIGVFAIAYNAKGQDTIPLSKKVILERVNENNLQIKIAEKNAASAKADYNQSNSLFLPSISASHTAISTSNPLMAFGSKLNQEVLTAADFNPALLNNPNQTQNYATKIDVLQPIINVDGFYGRQAAKSKFEAFQLQTERTKEYLQLEVNKAFMQLQLAYKAVEVLAKANATAQANLKLVENYAKEGMLQKTDLLSVQVRVNEVKNQWQYAKSNVQNASDYLAFLLNEDNSDKVYKPIEDISKTIDINDFDSKLISNRKDILAMDKSVEAYEKMAQMNKMSFLPRLNAFGSYEMFDTQIFQTGAKGYTIGAQLAWDVFDGYKSIGKLQKAKADLDKAQTESEQYKAQSQLELNKTNRQLKDAENRVSLSKLALEQSQEAYRIRENRFKEGLEKTTDLLNSETLQFQKELEYLQAVFDYNFTQKYLEFLTQ
ncbi:TolC family protein [Flavobacterium sp.]|uniref:TolC family protein n=1 Tax=Flavobacterium sp. TaxID=239 RepID=UPI002630C0D7|nr:TolC family protein [Flavobacterium sp.]MDD2985354.1 TolC family protein [Flavobacterium sp.]